MFLHNFYLGELLGSLFQPTDSPETEWVYAYSRNETLLSMSVAELREIEGLKMYYLQLDSSQRCMPVGGPLGYDTFSVYTFVNLAGYGSNGGYLKTWLRDEDRMLEIDFKEDLNSLGSSGDGLWGHAKSKAYLIMDTVYELTQMLLLILITAKIFLHSVSKLQTK